MDPVEKRVQELEKQVSDILRWQTADARNEQMDDAKVSTLLSIVAELSIKAGLSDDEFQRHYQIRFRWWHDYYLRQVEDVSPMRAAQLDPRTPEEADVSERYPLLFDSPPEGETA